MNWLTMLNRLRFLVILLFFVGPFSYGFSYKSVKDLKSANAYSASRVSSLYQKISSLKQKISEEQDKLNIANDGLRALNDSSLSKASELDSALILEDQIEFLKEEISQKLSEQLTSANEETDEELTLQLLYSFKVTYASQLSKDALTILDQIIISLSKKIGFIVNGELVLDQEIQMDLDQKTVSKLTVKLEKLKELQLSLDTVNKLYQQNKTKFQQRISEISKRIAELKKDLRGTEIALDRENKAIDVRSAEIERMEWEILKAELHEQRMRRVMRFAL